jgi:hypothetical protein
MRLGSSSVVSPSVGEPRNSNQAKSMLNDRQWSHGVFVFRGMRIEPKPTKLVLVLQDGTERVMNYENWGPDVYATEQKLRALTPGTRIRIATWQSAAYSPDKWFCDIDEVK